MHIFAVNQFKIFFRICRALLLHKAPNRLQLSIYFLLELTFEFQVVYSAFWSLKPRFYSCFHQEPNLSSLVSMKFKILIFNFVSKQLTKKKALPWLKWWKNMKNWQLSILIFVPIAGFFRFFHLCRSSQKAKIIINFCAQTK